MSDPVISARRDRAWLVGLFAAALVLRLAHVATIRDSPFFEWLILDPRMYDEWAQRIAAGEWLGDRPFFQDPLYPYLLAVLYRVVGHHYTPAVVVQAFAGATIAPLLFAASRRWLGFGAAAVTGILAATYLPSIYYEGLILKTALATWFVTVAVWFLSRILRADGDPTSGARDAAMARWIVLGVLCGLATLSRGNLLAFLPCLALWVWLDAPTGVAPSRGWKGRLRDRRALATAAALVVGAALVIGVVTLRNRVAGGEWVLTTSNAGQNFFIGNNPGNETGQYEKLPFVDANPKHEERGFAREAEARARRDGRLAADETLSAGAVSRYWFGQSLAWIADEPGAWLRLAWRKARVFWGAHEVPDNLDYYLYRDSAPILRLPLPGFGLVAPLGLLGAVLLVGRPGWTRALLLYLVVYSTSVVLFFVFSRFRMPLMPVLFVFAGHAAAETWRRLLALRARSADAGARRRVLAVAAALAVLFAWVNLPVRARTASPAFRIAELLHLPRRAETSAQGHFNLGLSYAAQAQEVKKDDTVSDDVARLLALAEEELYRALEDAETVYATNHVELGKVLARQGRNREAIAEYESAVALEPRDYRNHHAIGLLGRRLGDPVAAEAAFRKALELEPRHVASAVQLGEVLLEEGRRQEAAAVFRHALSLNPGSARARRGLEASES